MKVFKVVHQQL